MKLGTKFWTAKEDAMLRKLVAAGWSYRAIGAAFGRTNKAIGCRVRLLRQGLQSRPWSAQEDALLIDTAGYRTATDLARELKRTPAAINSRASDLGARWNKPSRGVRHSGLTATDVARMLGVSCQKTVVDWIQKGYLAGSRRAPRLGEGQKPAWRIMPDALRRFLVEYPWLYSRDRIADKGWASYVAANVPREEWIGTPEAARLLCLTVAGVTLAIRKGDLRAEKIGANWVVPMAAIRAYVPPPLGIDHRWRLPSCDEVAARRAANLAARKSVTYTLRPETVAKAVASRAAGRKRAA